MPDLASDAITEATSVFLNDPSKTRFTDVIMLPYIKRAHRELQIRYHNNGISLLNEVSSTVTIGAGDLTMGVNQPSDMVEPRHLEERASGETTYIDMTQKIWEPDDEQTSHLRYWVWREELIQFLGATEARQVRVYYLKSLSAISATSSPLGILNGLGFIAARAAALAARFNGQNSGLGESIDNEAAFFLQELIRRGTKTNQGTRTRRKSFRHKLRG
jgi:hypothetical protein